MVGEAVEGGVGSHTGVVIVFDADAEALSDKVEVLDGDVDAARVEEAADFVAVRKEVLEGFGVEARGGQVNSKVEDTRVLERRIVFTLLRWSIINGIVRQA